MMQNDYSHISFVEKEYAICFEKYKYYGGRQWTNIYKLKDLRICFTIGLFVNIIIINVVNLRLNLVFNFHVAVGH